MNKNVSFFLGSPRRNGNSTLLAGQVAKGVSDAGVTTETYTLHEMDIRPCKGCDACQNSESNQCIIDDDMQTLYTKLKAADTIVLASPIYWFTFTAQMKVFIDRWYAVGLGDNSIFHGKKFALILTYGDDDAFRSGAVNAIRTFQDICHYNKASIEGILYGSANALGEIVNNSTLMEKAYQLGKRLAALSNRSYSN